MADFQEQIPISTTGGQFIVYQSQVFEFINDSKIINSLDFNIEISNYVSGNLRVIPQISVDKENWINTPKTKDINADGTYFFTTERIGQYMRFLIDVDENTDLIFKVVSTPSSRDSKKDWYQRVAEGEILGYSIIHKFGRNQQVGTTLTPVCESGFYRTPTSPVTLAVISDNAGDDGEGIAGIGARKVVLEYLDGNFEFKTAEIRTNGTVEGTDVVTNVMRLLRAYVSESGTYANQTTFSQQGIITIRVQGGGQTWAVIGLQNGVGSGLGQSLIGAYTIPAGKTAYLLKSILTVESTKTANAFFFKREGADIVTVPYKPMRVQNIYTGISGVNELVHRTHEVFPEKTDIGFLAVTPPAGAADVSVEFELLLKDNV